MMHTSDRSTTSVDLIPFYKAFLAVLSCLLALAVLSACGGEEPGESPRAGDQQPGMEAAARSPESPARQRRRESDLMDPKDVEELEGRKRDGDVLAVTDPLPPDLVRRLPPAFPEDIPLGTWVSVEAVRLLGQTDFVLSSTTPYHRDAVGEFFVRNMPGRGWTLANRSAKPILSVYTFKKDNRAVTVMIKKQVAGESAAFDLSYKVN